MSLTSDLKKFAASIGIEQIGITSAAPLAIVLPTAAHYAFAGCQPHQHADPALLLPGAQSVICAAWPVTPQAPAPASRAEAISPDGVIAAYARGADYHQVLHGKLAQVVAFLERNAPSPHTSRIAVDNSPIFEKALAQRAGLGVIGYNTLLQTPAFGSYVMLGEVITTVRLTPDEPAATATCSMCGRCRQACPTGALQEPYTLNWNRCLSYVTQMRGAIPHSLRASLGQRVWGCDECQAACPANQRLTADAVPSTNENLLELLTLSAPEYKARFAHTALYWRGRTTLQRNAAIALGNVKSPAAVPALTATLQQHRSATVRGACAWALGQINTPDAAVTLQKALAGETEPAVVAEINAALALHRRSDETPG